MAETRIDKIAQKKWKSRKVKEGQPPQCYNLTPYGNRTEKGKIQSIKNLNYVISEEEYIDYLLGKVKAPLLKKDLTDEEKNLLKGRLLKYADEVKNTLNVDEGLFYVQQQIYYARDYPDLNSSSDLDNLHSLIMEQIIQKRYRKKLSRLKSVEGYKEMEKLIRDSFARMQKHELNLNLRRKDRKEEPQSDDIFAELANKINKRLQQEKDEIDDAVREFKEEDKVEVKS